MVPLVEPVGRLATNYPSSWPENIAGETQHGAMANQITSMVQSAFGKNYISVQGEFGENGQGMVYLKKNATQSGVNGRAYEATLIEVRAVKRLAAAAGKTYGVAAVIVTHGETDSGNTNYENELYQLWSDYNTDIKAITGQSQDLQMIVSQQNSCGDNSSSTVAQWKVGVNHPATIVCSGPKYQYPYSSDAVHLDTSGYEMNGEKYGQIYYERIVLGNNWQPLQPISASRNGNVVTVQFHVPVAPLVWDTAFQTPHQSESEWVNGKGFEVYASSTARITINSVSISGDRVLIACASDPGANCRVDYAMAQTSSAMSTPHAGTRRWGLLHDSDPFAGSTTNKAQPNWCVAFQMTIP
jgi:hypothetical protein